LYSVYDIAEEIHDQLPVSHGKANLITTFKDANLMHCKVTGNACTDILYMHKQTHIEWFSKRQNTVETATYGSKFVAARQVTEQIRDIHYTLCALGVP
jgi:hypothetical protein